jgi:hypothetical protein
MAWVKTMSLYSQEDIRRLQHCIYQIFSHDPRLYYNKGARRCGTVRNTFTKYWKEGLERGIFFPPQIRLKMYETRKEYIYLVQTDLVHELFKYYQNHPDVIYMAYTLGKFDLLIQTKKPLEVIPNNTIHYGSRSDYWYPETPHCEFDQALDKIDHLLQETHSPSYTLVEYPKEPHVKGEVWGWKVFPYLKYDLRPNYTWIVKNLGISFASFYKGFEYLLAVSTVLLPYYPYGFLQYSHRFFVFWTDYEEVIRDIFSYLPCHVSITRVHDALLVYTGILEKGKTKKQFFDLCWRMLELGLVRKFWTATPVFYWVPNPP